MLLGFLPRSWDVLAPHICQRLASFLTPVRNQL